MEKDTFKRNTISGISWSVGSQGSKLILNLGITAILARLLLPEDYGLISMVLVATGFLFVLKDFGFGAALVQKINVNPIEYFSVFWLNIFIGFGLASILFFGAPLISYFYEEPRLIPIAKVLSLSFILNSILIIPNNILLKNLKFKNLFFIDIIGLTISGAVGITFALFNYSYWSLVAQNIALHLTTVVLVFYFSEWRPSLQFSRKTLLDLRSFSLPLIVDSSINYWVRNIDYLLIGKVLGTAQLGYYGKAYTLMLLPVRQLSGTITKVMFPSFSIIQEDIKRVGIIYLKISGVVAMISFPLMSILFFAAEDLILFLFGENWIDSAPIFKVLCVLGAVQSISTLSGNIYLSQGKTKLMLQVGLITKTLMIAGIVIGLFSYGLMGLVYGYTISSLIASLIEWHYVAKIMSMDLKSIIKNLLPYVIFSLVMLVVLFFINKLIYFDTHIINLFFLSGIGGGLYIGLLLLLKPKAYKDSIILINEQR